MGLQLNKTHLVGSLGVRGAAHGEKDQGWVWRWESPTYPEQLSGYWTAWRQGIERRGENRGTWVRIRAVPGGCVLGNSPGWCLWTRTPIWAGKAELLKEIEGAYLV